MAVERTARIAEVVEHATETRAFRLTLPAGERLAFRPGQFISCLVPAGDRTLNRPYSIASTPEEPALELLVDLVPNGPGSHYLFGLRAGDALRFTGPWGMFVLDDALPDAETLFVADRSGIAPIRPMLREAVRRTQRPALRLLYGTRLGVYRRELEALPGLAVDVVPPEHVFDETLRRFVEGDQDRARRFFICGVGAPVIALRDRLRAAGYARRAVQYERW
jgi:ferredoxin-NADP reductase